MRFSFKFINFLEVTQKTKGSFCEDTVDAENMYGRRRTECDPAQSGMQTLTTDVAVG